MVQFTQYFQRELQSQFTTDAQSAFTIFQKLEERGSSDYTLLCVLNRSLVGLDENALNDDFELALVSAFDRFCMAMNGVVLVMVPDAVTRSLLVERTSSCVIPIQGDPTISILAKVRSGLNNVACLYLGRSAGPPSDDDAVLQFVAAQRLLGINALIAKRVNPGERDVGSDLIERYMYKAFNKKPDVQSANSTMQVWEYGI